MGRTVWRSGLIALVLLGAAGFYAYTRAAPTCRSDAAMRHIYALLHADYHFDSVMANDVKDVAGGWFSDRRECSAQVTEIRGNVNASDMHWRAIRTWIAPRSAGSGITVKLGGDVPLAPPPLSMWQRVRHYL